jgi:hypothetical protein
MGAKEMMVPGRHSSLASKPAWRGTAFVLMLTSAALDGCAPASDPTNSALQSLCENSSRLQDVELYDGSFGVSTAFVARHRRAVGMLRWRDDLALRYRDEAGNVGGQGWCSGTLIDDDLFLTAAHCLDNAETGTWKLPREKGGVPLSPAELAREFVVEFRYETAAQPELTAVRDRVEVLRLEEYRYGALDYALLRLNNHPGLRNRVARISPHDVEPGSPIVILQHPAALPMKIGAGAVTRMVGSKISYADIDTLGGSSGSGILDATTGKLVGIHTNGGCTNGGRGENYGITIEALRAASPTLRALVDESKDLFVGDWDRDGKTDLAVFYDGCLYPDANHDGQPDRDLRQCPAEPNADEYFVGRWASDRPTSLGWRRGGCVYLDTNPTLPLCFGEGVPRFEVLVADWNGDGRSDLGIQRGNCIGFDMNLDGSIDQGGYCYGNGLGEDEYLAGAWNGGKFDSVAVRRGNTVLIDNDRDGRSDESRVYGNGGNEDQYFAGTWDGDQRATLAVRRQLICLINHDVADGVAEEGRVYENFWSHE